MSETIAQIDFVEKAVVTVEDNGEVITFLKIGGKTFSIGPIYSGPQRKEKGEEFATKLRIALLALHKDLAGLPKKSEEKIDE